MHKGVSAEKSMKSMKNMICGKIAMAYVEYRENPNVWIQNNWDTLYGFLFSNSSSIIITSIVSGLMFFFQGIECFKFLKAKMKYN